MRACVEAAKGGCASTEQAHFLVGADGARSSVRRQLGFSWQGDPGVKRNCMDGRMFAVHLRASDLYRLNPNDRAWMYVMVHPALRAFIMSVDGEGEFAFHNQVPEGVDGDSYTEPDARRFFALASELDCEIEILSMATWTAGHALVASGFQQGRVFPGGDAAHLFTPTGGLATTPRSKMPSTWAGSWRPPSRARPGLRCCAATSWSASRWRCATRVMRASLPTASATSRQHLTWMTSRPRA